MPIQVTLASYSLPPGQDSWLPALPAEASLVSTQFAWCVLRLLGVLLWTARSSSCIYILCHELWERILLVGILALLLGM